MQFWCSATDTAWSWAWKPFPGVWIFVILVGLAVSRLERSGARAAGVTPRPMHPLALLGVLTLWLALDWPIGALGAGYLASIHMLQFLLIALVAAPAILAGLSPQALGVLTRGKPGVVLERLTRPVLALLIFNGVVLLTHLPPLVDGLMRTQLGSMLIDLLWLGSGLLFWFPVIAALPARPTFVPPLRMLYLVVGLMFSPIMFGLAGFMVYAQRPLYAIYELAPPFAGWTAKMDHEVAGVMMSVMGATVAFIGLSVIFFRWSKTDG